MHRAIVPVATMLAIQAMVSLCVLALGVMMPAVAKDLAIDPKLVGIFTAIIYAVAAVLALVAAGPIVRLGAVRICQIALLMAAIGLAFNALALVAATVIAVIFIGAAQGPINPASAHVLAQRVPRQWFGIVFSLKQTGVPIGFALAGVVFPFLLAHFGWRGASLVAAAMAIAAILVVELLRSRIDVVVTAGKPSIGIWRSIRFVLGHAQLRVLGWSAFVYVIAQHTFTFYLVTYLYEHCDLSIARAGLLLSISQLAGTGMRLVSGAIGDRIPRMLVLGWTGIAMTLGCVAIGLLEADTPFWLIAAGRRRLRLGRHQLERHVAGRVRPPLAARRDGGRGGGADGARLLRRGVRPAPVRADRLGCQLSRGVLGRGRLRARRRRLAAHGSFIPATVTISPHFFVSLAWKAASSSGVPGNGMP